MIERGLVVTLPIQVSTIGMSVPMQFDQDELRAWILYWDRLDFPVGGVMRPPPSAEELFLISAGVMQRTLADPSYLQGDKAHPNDRGYYLSTIDTYRLLDEAEPGKWALAYSKFNTRHPRQPSFPFRSEVREDSGFFDHEDDDAGRSLLFRLAGCLPVPQFDTPLEEILRFKEKRTAELVALRTHIEDLTQAVRAAPDRPLAETSAFNSLQLSAKNAVRASQEGPLRFRFMDLDWRLNLVPIGCALVAQQFVGLPLLESLVGAAALSIGPSVGLREPRQKDTPFEYVVSYTREFQR